MFSCEFSKISINTFLQKTPLVLYQLLHSFNLSMFIFTETDDLKGNKEGKESFLFLSITSTGS